MAASMPATRRNPPTFSPNSCNKLQLCLMPKYTKSGRKTAVADVESKLKKEYPGDKGAVYGTLNKIGLMRGNKTTAKGKRPAKKK